MTWIQGYLLRWYYLAPLVSFISKEKTERRLRLGEDSGRGGGGDNMRDSNLTS